MRFLKYKDIKAKGIVALTRPAYNQNLPLRPDFQATLNLFDNMVEAGWVDAVGRPLEWDHYRPKPTKEQIARDGRFIPRLDGVREREMM